MGGRAGGGASGGMGSRSAKNMTSAQRLANPNVKLSASDMNYKESWDEESNEDLGSNVLKTWNIPNVAYKDKGVTKTAYAIITQYLDKPGSTEIGGHQIYFDEPGPVGEAKTLGEAKTKLLNYINSKRK